MTCRCPICGDKNADTNRCRRSYVRVGITRDEHGWHNEVRTKKQSRKLRRVREKRKWRSEVML